MNRKKSASTIIVSIVMSASIFACSSLSLPLGIQTSTPTASTTPTEIPTETPTDTPTSTVTPTPIATLKIDSDLPMTGVNQADTQSIVNAEVLRLEQANYTACNGKYKLDYQALDDADPASGNWSPFKEQTNALIAVADDSVVAYLGTFNSGAAKVSIPILNKAGLLMLSPANTYPGLTKPGKGMTREPDIFYPNGVRNYARVTTADDVEGTIAARYAKEVLGINSVYVLDDQELYGQILSNSFEETAKEIGLTVVGHSSFDPNASTYKSLMKKIASSNNGKPPDAIYAGMVFTNNVSQLMDDKVAILGDNTQVKFIGPDAIYSQGFVNTVGQNAEGVYATVSGLPFDLYTTVGKQFAKDYSERYNMQSQPYGIYGYEAMNVVLAAIESICTNGGDPTQREAVRAAVFATKNFNGALGTWSFDANGDISLTDTTIYQVKNGQFIFVSTYK